MVHDPDSFAAVDLDRHRLSLGEADHARFVAAQNAIAEGRIDPDLARYDRLRRGIDRALGTLDINADSPVATEVRADARGRLTSFEIIEGRPPNGKDIDGMVSISMGFAASPMEAPDAQHPGDRDGDLAQAKPPFVVPRMPTRTPRHQEPIPGASGKDAAKDIPSWARGQRPLVGENGKAAARRVMDEQYGPGRWSETGREYQQLKKHFDRGYRNPTTGFPMDTEA